MALTINKRLLNSVLSLLMFLIGLNFSADAVIFAYAFSIWTWLFISRSNRLSLSVLISVIMYTAIMFSVIINDLDAVSTLAAKYGVLPLICVTMNCLAHRKKLELDSNKQIALYISLTFFFALGNMVHLIGDIAITDLTSINFGRRIINDIWTNGTAPTTIILGWGCLMPPVLLYCFDTKQKKPIRFVVSCILSAIYVVCSFVVATRIGIINFLIILIMYFWLKIKQRELIISGKTLFRLGIAIVVLIIGAVMVMPYIENSNLYLRMTKESLSLLDSNGRLRATGFLIEHFSESLFGGEYFTRSYGLQQHNLLFQMYDMFGIIPFIILTYMCIASAVHTVRINRIAEIPNAEKRYLILFFSALMLYYAEEPSFTSNFIISSMLFGYYGFVSGVNAYGGGNYGEKCKKESGL